MCLVLVVHKSRFCCHQCLSSLHCSTSRNSSRVKVTLNWVAVHPSLTNKTNHNKENLKSYLRNTIRIATTIERRHTCTLSAKTKTIFWQRCCRSLTTINTDALRTCFGSAPKHGQIVSISGILYADLIKSIRKSKVCHSF